MSRESGGFTLIELLIVIAIIAVLSSIAIVSYNRIKQTVLKNSVKTDVRNSLTSIVGFISTYNNYPNSGICGPGPMQCNLTDGIHTVNNGILASRGVIIRWDIPGDKCSDGSAKIVITGTHNQVSNWSVKYDSCQNKFEGF
ncbi:type II secretion system protein [Persephonella sp.]